MVSTIGDEYRLTIFPLSCPYDEAIKMVKDTGSLNHFAALSLSITYLTSMIVLQRKRRKYDMVMPHLGSVATGIFSDHRIRFMLHSQIPTGGHPFLESVHGGLIVKMCKLDNRCDM